jgi:hypothetical protein
VTSTYTAGTGVWSASGAKADVNTLLAGLSFNPALNFNGAFTVATSVSDGVAPAVTGTKAFTGTPRNDMPTGGVSITGTAGDGSDCWQSQHDSRWLTSDGLGTLHYQWLRGGVAIGGSRRCRHSYTTVLADVGATDQFAGVLYGRRQHGRSRCCHPSDHYDWRAHAFAPAGHVAP